MNTYKNYISIHFNETKYTRWYISIIDKSLLRGTKKPNKKDVGYVYYEAHHILPRAVFPEFASLKLHKWNLVLLTPKEHFICHWLLTKMSKEIRAEHKMKRAFAGMAQKTNHSRLTARQYEIAISAIRNLPGRVWSEEDKLRHREIMKKVMNTEETRRKCSEAKQGNVPWNRGKEMPEKMKINLAKTRQKSEVIKRISDAKKGKKNGMYGRTYVWNDKTFETMAIEKENLEQYLIQGFIRGRPPTPKETIEKMKETKKRNRLKGLE